MKQELKLFINLLALCFVAGTCFVFIYTFTLAYLSPLKEVVLNINSVGEANLEMFIITPLVILSNIILLLFLFENIKTFKKHESHNKCNDKKKRGERWLMLEA